LKKLSLPHFRLAGVYLNKLSCKFSRFEATVGKFLLLTLLFSTGLSAQNNFPKGVALEWKSVQSEYTNFSEIKPILVNEGKSSIFLSRLWPNDSAQLQRFNPDSKSWEDGAWGATCAVVANPDQPVEVKANTEREADLDWGLSTDPGDIPKYFVVGKSYERHPIEGRYRFFLRYTLKPWALGAGDPGKIFVFTSPEFTILPN